MEPDPLSIDARFSNEYVHRVRVTRGVFGQVPSANGENGDNGHAAARTLRELLAPTDRGSARVLVFLDDGVAAAWPKLERQIERWLAAQGEAVRVAGPIQRVIGGEEAKNDPALLEKTCRAIHDAKLCRRSYVLVIGGGAMLDLVGFAAAICHRGVRLIRMPTTTLAQCDSGIGVKNGVNAYGKKNYLGTFAVPWGVVNDEAFLATLSDRDWRCGFVEAVKVALIKDGEYFRQIARDASAIAARDEAASIPVLRRSVELHVEHIAGGGDPFEWTAARPLDFGHWAGHKLEQMTDYALRHGEAVAIGIAIDTLYAARIGLMSEAEAQAVLRCLEELGFALRHDALGDPDVLLEGLDEFREHLGGELTITLPTGLGSKVDVHEIDRATMIEVIGELADRSSAASGEVPGTLPGAHMVQPLSKGADDE